MAQASAGGETRRLRRSPISEWRHLWRYEQDEVLPTLAAVATLVPGSMMARVGVLSHGCLSSRHCCSTRSRLAHARLLFEYEPVVVEQLPFEADLVGADPRGEGQPEICAGEPPGQQLRASAMTTLEAACPIRAFHWLIVSVFVGQGIAAGKQTKVRPGAADDLLGTEGKP